MPREQAINPFAQSRARVESVAPESKAIERRKNALTTYVEQRVLAGFDAVAVLDKTELGDLKKYIAGLTPQEKVEALYGEIVVYSDLTRELGREQTPRAEMDIDPLLLARLSELWADTATRTSFLSRFTESREADKHVRRSAIGQEYHRLSNDREHLTNRFEEIEQDLFTGTITRADKVRSAKLTAERLISSKHAIENQLENVTTLKDRPATKENTDLAASIMFERLARYSDEAKSEQGFIWLPYFEEMLRKGVEGMQNGRWPMIIGESGTGKSEVAEAIIRRLSGQEPVMVACTARLSELDLVKRQEGGGVDTYGSLMQAATGYDRSSQTEPTHTTGRIVRLDEFLKLGEKAFALLKRARQLKAGGTYEDGKKVLPGFGAIGTSNPPGRRYGHAPMDAALEREFATIHSDFPPMTNADPELYEALLGALLDEHHHTDVHPAELSPRYRTDESEKGQPLKEKTKDPITGLEQEKDLGTISSREILENDPTNSEHGALWRFTHFVRAIQDAYSLGNRNESDPISVGALTYNIVAPDDTIVFDPNGSNILRLERATMTLEVKSWMTGYRERKTKDSRAAHIKTLTEWLQYKLTQYIESLSDDSDREKIQALASHFHLMDAPPQLQAHKPLTPLEIGKLSPRVPRPYTLEAASAVPAAEILPGADAKPLKTYATDVVVLEGGQEINLSRDPSAGFEFTKDGKPIHMRLGTVFMLHDERLIFAGKVEHPGHTLHGSLLVRLLGEALYRPITREEITERAEEFDMVFVIPGARNPYREALLEAGLTENEATAETKEMTVNISEEIRRQLDVYAEVKDADGRQLLQSWVTDISSNQHLIMAEVSKDYAKISERIKAGMVPVVMPSRAVQEASWEVALRKLKPTWMQSSTEEAVSDAYLYEEYKKQKMNRAGFFKDIPDRPYLVWTVPGQKPDAETCSKTFDEQRASYAELVRQNPDLYHQTDLIPTEYIALQSTFTSAVRQQFKEEQGEDANPGVIKPLDYDTYTRFLRAGAFSVGIVPRAYFDPGSVNRRVRFSTDDSDANGECGFRPAARS